MHIRTMMAASAVALLAGGTAMAQTEIEWWHAMGGRLGEKIDEIAANYNASQDQCVLSPNNRGTYAETLNAAIAAYRTGEHPEIVQVFEVGTGTMMAAGDAVYPVYRLMEDTGEEFDPDVYLPAVTGYYTTPEGQMLSMPFNSSTPVLYVNTGLLDELGVDYQDMPETWPEVLDLAGQAVDAGANCGFTSTWPGWTQIENFSAWHNIPIGTMMNGMAGLGTELTANNPSVLAHWQALADAEDEGIFTYGGRGSNAGQLFTGGECPIMLESSAGRASVEGAGIEFEMGMMPYWPDIAQGPDGGPQNSIIGGASLWVLSGHGDADYQCVADFFSHLSSPEVQADWHQFTGYLPITQAAFELSQEQGYYEENPGADVSIRQINLNEPTENSRGLRFGNMVQIREIVAEEFEAMLANDKTAQEALDSVVERGNEVLRQFEADNS